VALLIVRLEGNLAVAEIGLANKKKRERDRGTTARKK
jgi:hypothetical protein